jgi:serine protease Do
LTRQSGPLIGLSVIVSFLLGLVAAGTRALPAPGAAALRPRAEPLPMTLTPRLADAAPGPVGPGVDFVTVAARVNGAVVNVDAASRGDERPRLSRRFSADDVSGPHEGAGSGFIIDRAGYVLTNDHVIADADRVTVTLADGRTFRADVIGTDPAIDVALLQIHSRDPLPVAPLGNSEALRVGEWVCAIGNPLGVYVHSVTVGVVSYLGRKLFDQSLATYIQTDAAISFGNSGGPLVNTRGEVVGITTAMSAQALNVGFAIPITQVTGVLDQLREHGTVARGDLGVGLTTETPALRRALRLGPEHGALVQDLGGAGSAGRAGLRPYDLVTAIDGQAVQTDEELTRDVAARAPGTLATLDVWRDGGVVQLTVKLSVRDVSDGRGGRARPGDVRPAMQEESPLGLKVRDLDAETASHLHLPDSVEGVLVVDVDAAGPAHVAQVAPGSVLLEINRRQVRSAAEYRAMVAALKTGDPVALLIFDRVTARCSIRTVLTDTEP